MIANTTVVKRADRPQPKRHDDHARMPRKTGSHGTAFDAHHWFEQYRASHGGADSSDLLAGVPFN